jgi:hypothetical protein
MFEDSRYVSVCSETAEGSVSRALLEFRERATEV